MEKNYQKRFKQLGYEERPTSFVAKYAKGSKDKDSITITENNIIIKKNGKLSYISIDEHLAIRDLLRDI